MIGALDEAAMSIANAEDPEQEKADVRKVIRSLIDGLLNEPRRPASSRTRSKAGSSPERSQNRAQR
jgi:hypothetical protein